MIVELLQVALQLVALPLVAFPILGFFYRLTDELAVGGGGLFLGVLCGFLAGYLITDSYPATLMLGGILLGLIFADRFHTAAHRIGLGITILMVLYLGTPIVPPLPVIALAIAHLGDRQLGRMREPYSIFADTNIVFNVLLIGYAAWGILTLNNVGTFILAEFTYLFGGILLGSKERKRYSVGIGS